PPVSDRRCAAWSAAAAAGRGSPYGARLPDRTSAAAAARRRQRRGSRFQLRNVVIAVGPRPHVEDRGDGADIEFAIEMGEQFVIARALPAQGAAERIDIDGDQEQAGLAEIMLPRRLRDLGGGGEMNEAVAQVVRTAPVNALPFGLAPGRGRADFVDRGHGVADS